MGVRFTRQVYRFYRGIRESCQTLRGLVFLYMMMKRRNQVGKVFFHLAFPVSDLQEAKKFYVEGLGCGLGRESPAALTLELGGHQIVAHLSDQGSNPQKGIYPRHFGLIFTTEAQWQSLADRAKAKGLRFYQQPRRRFPGTRIEHLTFFLEDPFHNLLEFKYYKYESAIFGEQEFSQVGDTEE